MTAPAKRIIRTLLDKGVLIPNPESVEIGDDVNPDNISGKGVMIHAGSKIFGKTTLILKNTAIGREAPATIDNCQIGPDVTLAGGFFANSVFLKGASVGSCAHVREGTVFEEYATAAHSVGVKQTILFPWVTLGSQINFCDCLMAGGTGKKNHSEVGSSYIHFNFTPQQDKATPSLIGDVPAGVMLDQAPIFLGGQGGLVGPCRLTYGVTIAAGTIFRKDELRPNRLIFGGAAKSGNIAYTPGAYSNVRRIFRNNMVYIANLMALKQWYRHIRSLFITDLNGDFPAPLSDGALEKLDRALDERITRLEGFIHKLDRYHQAQPEKTREHRRGLCEKWPEIKARLASHRNYSGDEALLKSFIKSVQDHARKKPSDYLSSVQNLGANHKATGVQWLQKIVDEVVKSGMKLVESKGI